MLKVLKSGFYSTIQDNGRFGYREYGVPVSGAMDLYSGLFANTLLGNSSDNAVIEMTMLGGVFQFLKPTIIAVSGALMNPELNKKPIKQNAIIHVNANDILSFGRATKGFRTYLAIKNGFKSDIVLQSKSQYNSITVNSIVNKGDTIDYDGVVEKFSTTNASVKYDDSILTSTEIEAFAGPEFNQLSTSQKEVLLNSELKVSKYNNRMAYQLEPLIGNNIQPILTSPVLPGTVQLTPNGNLIVLMRDCQTTGGYPRVLQLTEKSINVLSQKSVGNILKIRLKG